MTILVVDYGMGNLHSVQHALQALGATVNVSADPDELAATERVVLPGVGSFGEAATRLKDSGWVEPLRRAVLDDKIPMLGICLGMQLLADRGYEGTPVDALGLIPGEVLRLEPETGERIPHTGWNEVVQTGEDPLFAGVAQGTDFYFVHSYRVSLQSAADSLAQTPYGGGFPSAIRRGNVFGVQFHPEKSSHAGRRLLQNFISFR